MNSGETLLAAAGPLPQWVFFMAVFGVIVVSALIVLFWVVLLRKPKNKKRKRRSRHHEKRKINPTLAESGGLPPVREPEKPPGQTTP